MSSDILTWRADTTAVAEEARRRSRLLRLLRKKRLDVKLLVAFHRSTAESVPVHRAEDPGHSPLDLLPSGCCCRISCFLTITLCKNTINGRTPSGDAPINRRLMNVDIRRSADGLKRGASEGQIRRRRAKLFQF